MADEPEYQLSEYEKMRLERIKRNQEKLAALGLDQSFGDRFRQQQPKKKKKAVNRKKTPSPKPGTERRSGRLSKAPQRMYQLSNDFEEEVAVEQDADYSDADEEHEPYQAKITARQVRQRIKLNRDDYAVSEEDMQNLRGFMDVDVVLAKFREFLRYHDKISESNERRVMPQARKLLKGEGVGYIHWRGKMFHKGDKITLMSDIVALMDEANECERKWGKDLGNGWLLNHPLKKLLIFQQFALQNPSFLASKSKIKDYCEGQDDEDDEDFETVDNMKEDERKPAAANSVPKNVSQDKSATPPKKKSNAKATIMPSNGTANKHIEARIAKHFDAGLFFGTITAYNSTSKVWFVEYDDGDSEEFDTNDLNSALRLYKKENKKDPKTQSKQGKAYGKRSAADGANTKSTPAAKKRKKATTPRSGSRRSPRCVAGM
jgi:hypothetical protein